MTKKMVQWNESTLYVTYCYIDSFLVMSFCEESYSSTVTGYYKIFSSDGKLFEPTLKDVIHRSDAHKKWIHIGRESEKIESIDIESLADMKPCREPTGIMMMQSLSDIIVATVD